MNFLAHIYLSGNDRQVQLGNFMADSIRGKQYVQYPKALQAGILLHRHIDSFTDAHPVYRQSKHRLHAAYGHYSGVIMDIFYDHFLAAQWAQYHPTPLADFAAEFYEYARTHTAWMPDKVQKMLPYMMGRNWLLSYATVEGIEHILFQMHRRIQQRVPMHEAGTELRQFYAEFAQEFGLFFEDIQASCQQLLPQLLAE